MLLHVANCASVKRLYARTFICFSRASAIPLFTLVYTDPFQELDNRH